MRVWAAALVAALAAGCQGLAPGPAGAETRSCVAGQGPVAQVCLTTQAAGSYPYGHRVLGATPEWTALEVISAEGAVARVTLEGAVFEDLAPRLADLDGDGVAEIVVVRSGFSEGARLEVYGAEPELRLLDATPPIGRRFRWLAPVGVADFDGDGAQDIAYVETPHLGKTLKVWRFADGALTQIAQLTGVTNHRIGEDFISGGLRECGQGPEMVLADASWREVVAVSLTGGRLAGARLGPFRGPASFDAALACQPVE